MRIYSEENKLYVESDYSAKFVREAKKLNGKWTGRAWRFDANDEEMVRDVLLKVYGEDEETARAKIAEIKENEPSIKDLIGE